MYTKITNIIIFGLIAFGISMILYPFYIRLIKRWKFGKTIREQDVSGKKSEIFSKLHQHKSGTPTMGGGSFFVVMAIMILISVLSEHVGYTNFSLLNAKEVGLPLLGFFGMGIVGVIDDVLNVMSIGKTKGLSTKAKTIGMLIFAIFISCRFYFALDIDYVNLRPFFGEVHFGIISIIFSIGFIYFVTNAINITDGMDGSVGGMMSMILITIGVLTFLDSKYLSTTIIIVIISCLMSFLRFNINPAKIFMGDSGALGLGGFLSVLIMLLNIQMGIFIPFMILFGIFTVTFLSSMLQILSKKYLGKKLFLVAPLHHYFEYKGVPEYTIVMKYWLVQGVLSAIILIIIFFQRSP